LNFWFLIWVFLAVFISGIFLWSLQILIRQKKTWGDFGRKHKLNVRTPALMKSPVVSGEFRGFLIQLYSEEQPTEDQRSKRFRTILQIEMPAMPVEGIVASQKNHAFANGLLDLTETYVPEFPGWESSILVKTSNTEILKSYLTDERLRAMQALMTIKTVSALYIFDRTTGFLRFETPDPLYDAQKLERLLSKITDQAALLRHA
jgi:hypothetical protein